MVVQLLHQLRLSLDSRARAHALPRAETIVVDEPQFRAAFEAHPPYQALLETIPTLLMTCEEPGLIGCGVLANEQAVTA